jgi:hypothetical protein
MKRDNNEWLKADRRERRRVILVTLAFLGAVIGSIAFAIYALTGP